MGKGRDPLAKRRDETDLQWRSRIDRHKQSERIRNEPIAPAESIAQGGMAKEFVTNLEDGTKTQTYRRRTTSSLLRLNLRGVITDDQLQAAIEIAGIAERIGKDVGVRVMRYGGRVDHEGSGRDPVAEGLNRVRCERAYSEWRLALPLPRGMILDMVTEDNRLAAIARQYNRSWVTAVGMLKDALDAWEDCRARAFKAISQDDVDEAVRLIA